MRLEKMPSEFQEALPVLEKLVLRLILSAVLYEMLC